MGRTHHLKETYLRNLQMAAEYLPQVEFILVNYNSQDDMETWVHTELDSYLKSGLVKYFHTQTPTHFHMAHAKNVSHKLATGDFLINLDADNGLSILYLLMLEKLALHEYLVACTPRWRERTFWSLYGRIAMAQEVFYALGGYDEHLIDGWGFDDGDLNNRAAASGYTRLTIPAPIMGPFIHHSTIETVQNYKSTLIEKEALAAFPDEHEFSAHLKIKFSDRAKAKSAENISNNILIANRGYEWGVL
jgi:hypothetical protein